MVTKEDFKKMIAGAAALIRRDHALLSELDSVAGDGDHGSTMLRVVERMERSFGPQSSPSLQECLSTAGWNVMEVDGGASSAILGAFLMGMGDAPAGSDLGIMFAHGTAAVRLHTQAERGDKTMIDALVPALLALQAAEKSGNSKAQALLAASQAARAGAEDTKKMVSKYGRARSAGARTLGHADPGATSVALVVEGFYCGITQAGG